MPTKVVIVCICKKLYTQKKCKYWRLHKHAFSHIFTLFFLNPPKPSLFTKCLWISLNFKVNLLYSGLCFDFILFVSLKPQCVRGLVDLTCLKIKYAVIITEKTDCSVVCFKTALNSVSKTRFQRNLMTFSLLLYR